MYRNILAAVDGTQASAGVVHAAAELASAMDAVVTIVAVVPPLPPFIYASGVDVPGLEEDARAEAERIAREAAASLPGEVATEVRHGDPGDEISALAREGGHDLVILGSRGRGRVASRTLGSVVGDVHFGAHVPMLVVPPPE
jgi:nucleotide-binding universal stress UspA family protein